MIRRILVCLLCLCLLLGTFSVGAAAKPTPPPAVEKTYDAYYYILNPDMGTEPASTRDTSAFTFMGQGKVGDGIQAPGDNAVKGQTIDITDANENWLTAVPEVNKVQTFEKKPNTVTQKTYPFIQYQGKTYYYAEDPANKNQDNTYSIVWYRYSSSGGFNIGAHSFDSATYCWHVDGYVTLSDKASVTYLVQFPGETAFSNVSSDGEKSATAFVDYVEKNSAFSTVDKPTMQDIKTENGKVYVFEGWYHDNGCTQPVADTEIISQDCVVYGKYTEVAAPNVPTVVGNSSVTVDCVNEEISHESKTYALLDGSYTTSNVTVNHGSINYTVTVNAAEYVEECSEDLGTAHTLNTGVAGSQDIVLTYNRANKAWIANPTSVTFQVVCETPEASLPPEQVALNKTAAELTEDDETTVTLSIGSTEEVVGADVVFVLDKSTSTDVKNEALAMLDELMEHTKASNLQVKVGLVTFNRVASNEEYNLPLTELNESSKQELQNIFSKTLTSGTNVEAGIRAGMEMLHADTSVPAENKHLVLVTDGVTYMWGTGETPNTIYVEFAGADNANNIWSSNSTANSVVDKTFFKITQLDYVKSFANPAQWMEDNAAIQGVVDQYETPYGTSTKYVSKENNTGYTSNDAAIYMAGKAWQDAAEAGYNLYAFASDKYANGTDANLNEEGYYPWASQFIGNLSTIGGTSYIFNEDSPADVDGMFDGVCNTILYTLDHGTVTDVIGDDFDLAGVDTFTLKVGNTEVTGVANGNTVNFGTAVSGVYPYVVTYSPATSTTPEQFVWQINVPVENGNALQLSYKLKLVNRETEIGKHEVPTNEQAELTYYATDNPTPGHQVFPIPQVSYTVEDDTPAPPVKPSRPVQPALNTDDHYAYIIGYDDGTVRPNSNISRAEVATIFFRLLDDDTRAYYWSSTNDYSDVSSDAWYNNAVSTMSNAGILTGYNDGTFRPDANITRAEFAAIAARFLSEVYTGSDYFTDTDGHWAEEYINRAADAGWINGYNDGSFRPDQAITRAEAMTLVNAVLERKPHEDHLLDDMVTWPDNPKTAWYYEEIQEATNSHDYTWSKAGDYELWQSLLENRDWNKLEKIWSDAYSAPGGEVMD